MKTDLVIFCAISTILFVGCTSHTIESAPFSQIQEDFNAAKAAKAACQVDSACDVAADALEEDLNGGIKQEYTVNGCKVSIYNDGPIRMVHEKTDQPCNAPIPKDHSFGGTKRVYQENGCIITEYSHKNGIGDATMDCSERDLKK